jgi:hypothetical protein
MISELLKKDINPETYAKKVIENPDKINQYLDGLLSKNETYRYNCFKVINIVSEKKPDILYPHWDFFKNHLKSKNNYHKMSALTILANLTSIDREDRFKKIFNEYFENLKSEKTIVPIYVVKSSGKIASFKPEFEDKITELLLDIENIYPGKQIELLKSAVIESFSELYDIAQKKNKIVSFVKKQLKSESPKTRKAARDFINKWGRD